jgi:hypothetical protein
MLPRAYIQPWVTAHMEVLRQERALLVVPCVAVAAWRLWGTTMGAPAWQVGMGRVRGIIKGLGKWDVSWQRTTYPLYSCNWVLRACERGRSVRITSCISALKRSAALAPRAKSTR